MRFKKFVTMVIMTIMVFTLILPNVTLAGGPTDGIYCPRCKGGNKVVLYQNGQFCNGHEGDTTIHEPTCEDYGYIVCTKCPGQGGVGSCDHEFSVELTNVPPLGHIESEPVIEDYEPGNCVASGGYNEVIYCERCHEVVSKNWVTLPMDPDNHVGIEVNPGWEATCSEEGKTDTVYCEACDKVITYGQIIPALEPDWSDWKVIKEPTCQEVGAEYRVCKRCEGKASGHKEDRIITFADHKWGDPEDDGWDKKPTCTEDGIMSQKHVCEECGYDESVELRIVPALGHDLEHTDEYLVDYKNPSCTKSGYFTYKCSRCDYTETDYVDPLGHDIAHTDEYLVAHIEPTCTDHGESIWQCKNCSYVESESIPATGHDWNDWVFDGFHWEDTQTVILSRMCNNDHHHVEMIEVPSVQIYAHNPTCTEDGNYRFFVYRDNKRIFSDDSNKTWYFILTPYEIITDNFDETIIPALGHKPVALEDEEPWCEDIGHEGGTICARCQKILKYPTEIPELGHIWGKPILSYPYEDAASFKMVCERDASHNCGYYVKWTHVPYTEPTCTKDGMIDHYEFFDESGTFGNNEWIYIYDLIHSGNHYEYTVTKNKQEIIIDKLGHDIDHTDEYLVDHKDVTCTEDGYDIWQCSRCEHTERADYEKLGHDYKLIDFVYPTCIEDGYEYWECSHDPTHTLTIPVMIDPNDGHKPVPMEDVDPWCTDKGHTGGIICELCQKILEMPTEVDPLGHIWGKPVLQNLCDTGAQFSVTCERDSSHAYYLYTPWSHVPATKETCCASGNVDYYKFYDEEGVFAKDSFVYIYNVENQGNYYTYTLTTQLDDVLIDSYGPQWSDWVVTEPKCTKDGVKTRVCTECDGEVEGHKETEVIAATGHDWGDWEFNWVSQDEINLYRYCNNNPNHIEQHRLLHGVYLRYYPPTCTESGRWATLEYTDYDNILSDEPCVDWYFIHKDSSSVMTTDESEMYIDPIGHNYELSKHVDATCTEDGYDYYECTHNGAHNYTVITDKALGHDIDHVEEYLSDHKDATCEEDGYDTYKCSRCDYTETDPIEATGHHWGEEYEVVVKEPTEDEEGLIEIRHKCEICDKEEVIGTKTIPVIEPETETETETEEPTEPETETETVEPTSEDPTEEPTVEPTTEEPTETETYTEWTTEYETQNKDLPPQTGDESNLYMWIALMGACAIICATGLIILGKRRKDS